MPTFDRLMIPVAVAALAGAAFTGVLAAQTGSGEKSTAMAAASMGAQIERPATGAADPAGPATAQAAGVAKVSPTPNHFAAGMAAYAEGDLGRAIEAWEAAARDGHVAAQWNLARIYLNRSGPSSDRARAVQLLRNIAMLHDPDRPGAPRSAIAVEALVELGRLHWEGVPDAGLQPAPQYAARLFEHAATLYGHPRAQHYLGVMYLKGEGVKQNVGRAVRWLFLAANKRYAPSQAALGDYFWKHEDAGKYRVRGLMWLALASENAKGDDVRAKLRDRYNLALAEVRPEERAQAAAMIESWNARYVTAAK